VEWFQKNWSNATTVGCICIAGLIEAWQQSAGSLSQSTPLPRLQGGWHFVPLILLIVAGVVWLIGRRKTAAHAQLQTSAVVPGIPSLSALLGQNPKTEFDAKQFFAVAHYSPITAELEENIKCVAQQYSPNDREAFYARIIGIGAVAYHHDVTWFTIYGSQLNAMAELNSRGIIPVTELKRHYDKAVVDYPRTYEHYSYEQWLDYMQSRMLIAKYQSQMVEISFNGKDFLKYLAHVGRDVNSKLN
jgi:hypothetical protein